MIEGADWRLAHCDGRARATRAAAAGAALAGGHAAAARAHGQRVPVLPAARLPRCGSRASGRIRPTRSRAAAAIAASTTGRRLPRRPTRCPKASACTPARSRSHPSASGLIARIDLIEAEDGKVTPVDYKRGKRPHVAAGAYEPERVQLCVQGLLLEEHGYRCEEGVLYFAESRERVRVPFDEELRRTTLDAVHGLRLTAASGRIPPPLEDSPKCPRCALVGICLPDEVAFLKRGLIQPRPLAVAREDALPLYVQARGRAHPQERRDPRDHGRGRRHRPRRA